MLKKLGMSLLGLLSSVIALWGVVRMGWTVEMFVPGALSMIFFGVAFAVGNDVAVPMRGRSLTTPPRVPAVRPTTQRYEFGKLTSGNSA